MVQVINRSETERFFYWTEVRPVIKVYYTLVAKAVPYALKYGEWRIRDVLHCEVYASMQEAEAAIPDVALWDGVPERRIEIVRHERQDSKLVRCRKAK